MNILHVYRSLDRKIGGPATSVPALCRELSFLDDCNISLLTFSVGDVKNMEDIGITKLIVKQCRQSEILSLVFKVFPNLPELINKVDIIHLHGVWPLLNTLMAVYALMHKKKVIITPRASLLPQDFAKTKFKKFKKKIAWNLYIKYWARKAYFHATAENEFQAIKDNWHMGDIVQIPNGINVSEFSTLPSKDIVVDRFPELKDKKILFFLSRIDRKKGLPLLAHAWGKLAVDFPDWHLLIVGQGDTKHWLEIEAILKNANIENRYTYSTHTDGELRLSAYNAAELFVLPTYWENFGIVIAEALMAATPVITTTKTPWKELASKACGWTIEPTEGSLINVLRTAMEKDSRSLKKMGQRGRSYVIQQFDWRNIAVDMEKYYKYILGRRDKPEFVYQFKNTNDPVVPSIKSGCYNELA